MSLCIHDNIFSHCATCCPPKSKLLSDRLEMVDVLVELRQKAINEGMTLLDIDEINNMRTREDK